MSKTSRPQIKPPPSNERLIPAVIVGVLVIISAIIALVMNNQKAPFEPEVTGAPRAEINQTVIDHGSLRFEQMVQSVFRIRNVGDRPLTIAGEPRVELIQGC